MRGAGIDDELGWPAERALFRLGRSLRRAERCDRRRHEANFGVRDASVDDTIGIENRASCKSRDDATADTASDCAYRKSLDAGGRNCPQMRRFHGENLRCCAAAPKNP